MADTKQKKGVDPLNLAGPSKLTKLKAKNLRKKKDLDKLKKARLALREHKKLGWDGYGSTKRDVPQRGTIKYETKESGRKFPAWNRKLISLQKKLDSLK